MSEQPFMPPKREDIDNVIKSYGGDHEVMQAVTLLRIGGVEQYLAAQNGRVRTNTADMIQIKAEQKSQRLTLKEIGINGFPGGRRRSDPDTSACADKAALKVLSINLSSKQLTTAILIGLAVLTVNILNACGVF